MFKLRVAVTILLTLILIESVCPQRNYCMANLCRGRRHIGCRNTGAFGRACSPNAKLITMSVSFRRRIVEVHNFLRNRVAQGGVNGYQPAIRMASMVWNQELAALSALHTKRCILRHDQCRNTQLFRFSGQNVGRTSWRGLRPKYQVVAVRMINSWFGENSRCNMEQIGNLTAAIVRRCGHFTVMVQEKNNAVGCSILQQTRNGRTMQYITCNYGYNNINNLAVYRAGGVASNCTSGTNPQFPGLCSIREMYALTSTEW